LLAEYRTAKLRHPRKPQEGAVQTRMLVVLTAAVLAPAALVTALSPGAPPAIHDHVADATSSLMRPQDPALPAEANTARERLEKSPRHGEWAMIPAGGSDSLRAWVVYPERPSRAPVILVVHEIFGLTNWIRAVADQLAADGFIAIAPDLMTAHALPVGPEGDPVREQATTTIRTLEPQQYHQQLMRVAEWGMKLPAAAPRYGVVGFCWGGAASFQHAVVSPQVGAAVVYYGSAPAAASLAQIRAPVLGLYAGDDARVNASVPAAEAEMKRLGRTYEVHTFDGAGHGFLRAQDGRDGANLSASRRAWPLTLAFFRKHLDSES
jgi:carboxymethylenebutenolidase